MSKDQVEVAVLMPVYAKDDARAFRIAFEAIGVGQTVKPGLVVIVVDGPVTLEIEQVLSSLESYDIRVVIIRSDENVGLSNALASGVEFLRGKCKYIIRTDSDDISRASRVHDQYLYMELNDNVDLASSQVNIFEKSPCNSVGKRCLPVGENIASFAMKRTPINHSASIFRTSALGACNYPDSRLPFEDWWISLRILKLGGRIGVIDKVHLDFRGGEDMISRRSGFKYAKQELQYFISVYKEGLLPLRYVSSNIMKRSIFRFMPLRVLKLLYRYKLHS